MALKWSNNGCDSGILRKHEIHEPKEELLVFGYSCKLFRDDERALLIDQGKHLIPWMGDDTLKIDRYDGRGALGAPELAAAEAEAEADKGWQQLTPEEQRAERLCDEERYRALHCDEDEEEMYREEELKRLHMARGASYGQVGFNYDGDSSQMAEKKTIIEEVIKPEDEEPFVPPPQLNVPEGMPLPDTKKLNAIVEKTAVFIAGQGTQMEILLKAKQAGNSQFDFLSLECPLHRYYSFLLAAIRQGRYRPQQEQEQKEEKPEEEDYYLHPSLAPVSVESAPSIPSIAYKPSADCAYSMLVNQIKGRTDKNKAEPQDHDDNSNSYTEADLAPPGTEILPLPVPEKYLKDTPVTKLPATSQEQYDLYASQGYSMGYYATSQPPNNAEISKAPILYKNKIDVSDNPQPSVDSQISQDSGVTSLPISNEKVLSAGNTPIETWDTHSNTSSPRPEFNKPSSGLKLIHYSDSEDSDSSTGSKTSSQSSQNRPFIIPPSDQQLIVDKMASYVAKNGDDFERIVKMKGDPRFSFLTPTHEFHPYYRHKRAFYERAAKPSTASQPDSENEATPKPQNDVKSSTPEQRKVIAPVSFSIKKMKEPEPILPKPALPYESSSEEETANNDASETSNKSAAVVTETKPPQLPSPQKPSKETEHPPKVELAHMHPKPDPSPVPKVELPPVDNVKLLSSVSELNLKRKSCERKVPLAKSPTTEESNDSAEERRKRKKRRSKSREEKRPKVSDVITIEEELAFRDPSIIDLTEDLEESEKNGVDGPNRYKIQTDRKMRAAAFLSSLKGVTPVKQHHTLASAMVKTLHTLQHKEESKRRKKRDSSRKKSKKSDRRRSRERSYSSESEDASEEYDNNDDKSHRRHHKRDRHTRKTKRKSYGSPSLSKSRSHHKKTSSRHSQDSLAKHRRSEEEQKKLKSAEDAYRTSRKHDKLLTSSLKELVRETRKDLTASEPIKMAVQLFTNDSSSEKYESSADKDTALLNQDWDKKSGSKKDGHTSDSNSSESCNSN